MSNSEVTEENKQTHKLNPKVGDWFGHFSSRASAWLGSKWAFSGAVLIIVCWAFTGPMFGYSDTWQLVINTGTTIVTFLMVFLIQNTQNRDARAINLKLDELIHAISRADAAMADELPAPAAVSIAARRSQTTPFGCAVPASTGAS